MELGSQVFVGSVDAVGLSEESGTFKALGVLDMELGKWLIWKLAWLG